MLYRREFLDLNNPEDYRFAIKFFHDASKPPKRAWIEVLYHQEFGTEEELKDAIKFLEDEAESDEWNATLKQRIILKQLAQQL